MQWCRTFYDSLKSPEDCVVPDRCRIANMNTIFPCNAGCPHYRFKSSFPPVISSCRIMSFDPSLIYCIARDLDLARSFTMVIMGDIETH